MPRTVDHIVEMHQIARGLRNAGKPVWSETVDVSGWFHDETLTFEQRRDAIVGALKTTRWYQNADPDEFDGIREIIDYHLGESPDVDEFDGWWNELYDHADYARVWIKTV